MGSRRYKYGNKLAIAIVPGEKKKKVTTVRLV